MEDRLRYLFQRYVDNSCSRKELEEFLALIQRSSQDAPLRELIRRVYNELKENSAGTYVDENGRLVLTETEWAPVSSAIGREKTTSSRFTARVLAVAAVVIVAALLWIPPGKTGGRATLPPSLTTKATDRSESKFILLQDSTKVWLNAASSLEFPDQFSADKREVYLKGEAFFDVKHADKIPFIIHTGSVSTTVLGTAFNIKAYPDQKSITVSVSRGKVKVARRDGWETTLTMGQQVKVAENRKSITEKNVVVGEVAAWQQGDIVFDDEPLADIITDMERIYNTNIKVEKTSLLGLSISTSFRKDIGVEQALQVLCKLTESSLAKNNGIYIIQ